MQILNPSNGKLITELQTDGLESVEKKYQALVTGQQQWSIVPLPERIKIIKNFSGLLEQNIDRKSVV